MICPFCKKEIIQAETPFRKLQGLWYLLLKECSSHTGYSELYWKKQLKMQGAFYISVREPNGQVTRDYKSVSASECNMDELSALFNTAFKFIDENEIIDLTEFKNRYNLITGKEL